MGGRERMPSFARQALLMPFWLAQVFTQEKFFARNPVIGSRWLNERGLHTARVRLAGRLADRRRRRLAHLISPEDRRQLDRDGFVVKRDFLPPDLFADLVDAGPRLAGAGARDGRGRHDHPPYRARPGGAGAGTGGAGAARPAGMAQPDRLCRLLGGGADGLCPDDHQRRRAGPARPADRAAHRHLPPDRQGVAVPDRCRRRTRCRSSTCRARTA